ncbi:MAG: YajQ family cyclic di-GMP-binding protein [Candidatus Acidulodesulfobacterium ferriphilum]|uniref:Nucleotide-binding protein EVJ47_03300 n=1 Tax=Candidatus Acidulodesulfobacterium ferriphilum TaxID=2597223 RepID=A0A519BDG1_9DELT|nr:MAG: YajQ family cyclic di-GMP-binding protein [Candidatus Acidulodesulfobacterium ferriphilum]
MPSFDVVSKADLQEVDNAINQTVKEITGRYDFKGTKSEIKRQENIVTVLGDDDYKLTAVIDIFKGKLIKRGVSVKFLDFKKKEEAHKGMVRQEVEIKEGIDKEASKKIIQEIKKIAPKAAVENLKDHLRVGSKSKDELQGIISHLRAFPLTIELSFINFRD